MLFPLDRLCHDFAVEIEAPAARVWAVLTDFGVVKAAAVAEAETPPPAALDDPPLVLADPPELGADRPWRPLGKVLLDQGVLTEDQLGELAKADRQPALALTDTDNMFGALEFSDKMAGYGIQPIVGCALAIDFGDTDHGPRNGNVQPERTRIAADDPQAKRVKRRDRDYLREPGHDARHERGTERAVASDADREHAGAVGVVDEEVLALRAHVEAGKLSVELGTVDGAAH